MSWGFDVDNRVGSMTNLDYPNENLTYTYDHDSQLINAAASYGGYGGYGGLGGGSYSWDDNGNSTKTGWITGAGNRLLFDGTYSYVYDESGHIVQRSTTTAETDYFWDNRGRLFRVKDYTKSNNTLTQIQQVDYGYDAFNDLISRTSTPYTSGNPSTTGVIATRFVYDLPDGNAVLAFNGNGSMTDRYLWGPAVDQILADERFTPSGSNQMPSTAGTTYWALTDNENSVRDWITYGSLVDHIIYDSFGKVYSHSNFSITFAFGHNGIFYDPATGLEYHSQPSTGLPGRWYNPSIQRWMSEDMIGLSPDTNPYRYVGNSPTNFADPTGSSKSSDGDPNVTTFAKNNGSIPNGHWLIIATSANTDDLGGGTGHAWVAIVNKQAHGPKQTPETETTARGFYPVDGTTPTDNNPCNGEIRDDGKKKFKQAIAREITEDQYVTLKRFLEQQKAHPRQYQIRNHNCASFVNDVLSQSQLGLTINGEQRPLLPGTGPWVSPTSLFNTVNSPNLPPPWFPYDPKRNWVPRP
jgi:RHS repeat-associated protein